MRLSVVFVPLLAVGGLAPSTATAAFEARGGIHHAYVLDATRGERLELLNAQGRVVRKGRADRLGSEIFRTVPPGRGYTVRRMAGRRVPRSKAFRVLRPGQNPTQSFYRRKTLKQGLNYVTMRDGVELAMTVRLPRGKTLDDGPFATVIEYSGYQVAAPARPLRLGRESADRRQHRAGPARAGERHRRRLADRADARLRCGERADARLGLFGRCLRPLRPADDL
jgi:hypothetical protein